jgi:hypothetical protein
MAAWLTMTALFDAVVSLSSATAIALAKRDSERYERLSGWWIASVVACVLAFAWNGEDLNEYVLSQPWAAEIIEATAWLAVPIAALYWIAFRWMVPRIDSERE